MKGQYTIKVQSKRVNFELTVERNITVIRGDSATGKTTLVNMIQQYYDEGEASGINLQCDKECEVLRGRKWETILPTIKDSIVFIDEGNKFVSSEDFAKAIKHTDNYYVIISRDTLANLPYSINSVLSLKESNKYISIKQVYNEAFRLYQGLCTKKNIKPTLIITEDSKAGGQFFESLGIACIHAAGKSKIIQKLESINIESYESILIIADGAALGSDIEAIMQMIKAYKNISLYTPESFEWLLLKADILPNGNEVKKILDKPYDYIDSTQHFSWERFFTAYLVKFTTLLEENKILLGYKYPSNKGELPKAYLNARNVSKILSVIPHIKFK